MRRVDVTILGLTLVIVIVTHDCNRQILHYNVRRVAPGHWRYGVCVRKHWGKHLVGNPAGGLVRLHRRSARKIKVPKVRREGVLPVWSGSAQCSVLQIIQVGLLSLSLREVWLLLWPRGGLIRGVAGSPRRRRSLVLGIWLCRRPHRRSLHRRRFNGMNATVPAVAGVSPRIVTV